MLVFDLTDQIRSRNLITSGPGPGTLLREHRRTTYRAWSATRWVRNHDTPGTKARHTAHGARHAG
jgi:hypothetical protein